MNVSDKQSSTRENILKAALTLFSQKGYLGATTKEIARDAGIAEVTLFRHFPSKEKLLEEVLGQHSFLPALKELLPEVVDLPYVEGLTVIATRFLDSLVLRKERVRIILAEAQRFPDKLHSVVYSYLEELFETFAAYIVAMQQKGELRDVNPECAARAFHGIFFNYFSVEEILTRKRFMHTDRATTVKEFVDIFARGTLHSQ